jgi:type IV secretion system protein VirB9
MMRFLFAGLSLALLLSPPMAMAQVVADQCPALSVGATEAPQARRTRREPTPSELLARANEAARQRPETTSFTQARQIYTYAPGAIYELYTSPSFISAILLEPGESLGDVAAGDTSRWMVQETSAETGIDGRTIVLVKPQTTGLRTNIVLVTDRRTYTIEAIAQAGSAYSAQIAWCYPAEEEARMASVDQLHFGYRVRSTRGGRPNWMPTRVFDDGRRTWIEMPEAVASSDLPPLFVITGEGAELVNYRVQGRRYMVDRIFDVAELRLGTRSPTIVRIEREGATTQRRPVRPGGRS